jgi:hypothetical protein
MESYSWPILPSSDIKGNRNVMVSACIGGGFPPRILLWGILQLEKVKKMKT